MRFKFYLLLITLCVGQTPLLLAQKPLERWSKIIDYGDNGESYFTIKPTKDKGFLLGGTDNLQSYYFHGLKTGMGHGFISKVDSLGNPIWSTNVSLENDITSVVTSLEETRDGGCIGAAFKRDLSYDSSILNIIKLSSDGAIEWSKNFGGSKGDRPNKIIHTNDNGYLVVGSTNSTDGDVIGAHITDPLSWAPPTDAWVVKLNAAGDIEWAKSFGGFASDEGESAIQTADDGYMIVGSASSSDGDLTNNKGNLDGWVFKIDRLGNLLWQRNFGGADNDNFKDIVATNNNNFLITGHSASNNADVVANRGGADIWVVSIDHDGNLNWSKCFGGTNDEYACGSQRTFNNNLLITGSTNSNNGDVSFNNGNTDIWVLMVSNDGSLIWETTSGTPQYEVGGAVAFLSENEYVVAGWRSSIIDYAHLYTDGLLIRFGNASTIKGTAFLDANSNSIKDPGELPFDKLTINVEKPGYNKSTIPFKGEFRLNVDTGAYTSSAVISNPYYTVSPSSYNSTFETYFQTDSISFAIQPIPGVKDLVVSIVPLAVARPGFGTHYKIVYNNAGTEAITSGVVTLTKDSRLNFSYSLPAPSSINGNVFTWNFTHLNPSDTATISLLFTVLAPPATNNGDVLESTASISPLTGDVAPVDNTYKLKQLVTGSYDPNDKTESHGGTITPEEIALGTYLNYVIRFQNTGTDTAFTVIVRDTLSALLDWSTLQMVSASHDYQLQINDLNKLEWHFNDIELVDSIKNEPASHGYIAFRIKALTSLVVNDIVDNAAGIYFDYNLPIQTNTASTIVAEYIVLPVKLSNFTARLQNERSVNINWQTSHEDNSSYFEVQRSQDGVHFRPLATVRSSNNLSGNNYEVKDNDPLDGANYYRLKMVDRDGTFIYSAIELVNAKSGVAILASLSPNPSNGQVVLKLQGKVKGRVSFSITDLAGKMLEKKDFGYLFTDRLVTNLNASQLPRGTYIVSFRIDDKLLTQTLVIQ